MFAIHWILLCFLDPYIPVRATKEKVTFEVGEK
jgi:hypothetical protein